MGWQQLPELKLKEEKKKVDQHTQKAKTEQKKKGQRTQDMWDKIKWSTAVFACLSVCLSVCFKSLCFCFTQFCLCHFCLYEYICFSTKVIPIHRQRSRHSNIPEAYHFKEQRFNPLRYWTSIIKLLSVLQTVYGIQYNFTLMTQNYPGEHQL